MGAAPDVHAFSFDSKKSRRSASGIACASTSPGHRCLVVFDDGVKAQFAALGPEIMTPTGPPIDLIGTGGELDAEGAAFADGFYYVAGSHSTRRGSCKPNPASHLIVRFEAPADLAKPTAGSGMTRSGRLWEPMLEEPYLQTHAEGCLGDGKGGTVEQMAQTVQG